LASTLVQEFTRDVQQRREIERFGQQAGPGYHRHVESAGKVAGEKNDPKPWNTLHQALG
jgi:hypothetical protein